MRNKTSLQEIQSIIKISREKKIIDDNDNSIIFFDIDKIINQIKNIKTAFPKNTLHAIAIKTNPLLKILKIINNEDVGAEAASISELRLAKAAGFSGEKIVFDSPVKTKKEIIETLNNNSHLNIDNLEELKRIKAILKYTNSKSTYCLRINPQIGGGKIKSMNVGNEYSKFGIPIKYNKQEIINAFLNNSFLSGLHVHSGSQGLSLEKLSEGVKVAYNLANEINDILNRRHCKNRVQIIDIGGGLPIAYRENEESPTAKDYVDILNFKCPSLFDRYRIITEFGRFIYGNAGWTISKVEYVKHQPNANTALIHVGADLFLRESYNPSDWYHRIDTIKNDGELNESIKKYNYTIGGPLCFGGDILQKDVLLPKLNEHDLIVIHDTGANTLNLWSRHCSREIPKVIGYYNGGEKFVLLKNKESFSDIINFWT